MGAAITQEKIDLVLSMMKQGRTQDDITIKTNVARSTISKMKKDGRLPAVIEVEKKDRKKREPKTKMEVKTYSMPHEEVVKLFGEIGQYKEKQPLFLNLDRKKDDLSEELPVFDKVVEKQTNNDVIDN